MTRHESHANDSVLLSSLLETFEPRPPVYEFDFCPGAGPSVSSVGTSPVETSPAANGSDPAQIDRIDDLANLPFADASAQTIICRGALEYVFEPRRAVAEMERILKPGGTIFVCVPGSRARMGAGHFWHFTPHALQQLMQPFGATIVGWQGPEEQPHTVFVAACKGKADAAFLRGVNLFPEYCRDKLGRSAARIGWIRKLKRAMVAWAFSPAERRRFADHYRVQYAIHMPVEGLSRRELLASCLGEITSGSRLDLEQ
ncbi:MAG: class I SAM-dependent methyltransferase [Planctomycetota bacterium]|nr:class I SAM-dependent methyltransferase [Planctomycetota bacterium]